MFIPELLEPDDPFARTRADLEEYLATGKCATETHGCDNSQTAPTTKRCEICGTKEATETYDIDMYYIEKKEYVPPFGKKFKYRTQKVKVPCCASCIKSIGRGNVVVSIVVLLSATLAYLFLFSHVASSVLQHIVAFVFVCCITGFLGLPIFHFSCNFVYLIYLPEKNSLL